MGDTGGEVKSGWVKKGFLVHPVHKHLLPVDFHDVCLFILSFAVLSLAAGAGIGADTAGDWHTAVEHAAGSGVCSTWHTLLAAANCWLPLPEYMMCPGHTMPSVPMCCVLLVLVLQVVVCCWCPCSASSLVSATFRSAAGQKACERLLVSCSSSLHN